MQRTSNTETGTVISMQVHVKCIAPDATAHVSSMGAAIKKTPGPVLTEFAAAFSRTLNLFCIVVSAQRVLWEVPPGVHGDKHLTVGILMLMTSTNLEKRHNYLFIL